MKSRTIISSLASTLVVWAGTTSVALARDPASAAGNRMDAIAGRMVRGESYDQATRATLPGSGTTIRRDLHVSGPSALDSYDRVAGARLATPEDAAAVNARFEKHLTAMNSLGAHEAGWIASMKK